MAGDVRRRAGAIVDHEYFDRQRLAVLRELYNWREQQAAQHNRPPRTLIRDDLLLEIARRKIAEARGRRRSFAAEAP